MGENNSRGDQLCLSSYKTVKLVRLRINVFSADGVPGEFLTGSAFPAEGLLFSSQVDCWL
jgi:hypothetical protein